MFADRDVVILDGGLATELEARGHDLGDELWSARLLGDDPAAIRAVHDAYLDAGAEIITTASYQATIDGFMRRGATRPEAEDLLRRSVRLAVDARDARGSSALVAASIGPYGAARADGSEFTGAYGVEGLEAFHRPRWEILASAGADLLACETIPSAGEARVLTGLLRDTPGVEAWFSFSARDDRRISDGTPLAECARELDGQDRVAAIGVNCTAPELIEPLIREARTATAKPIIVYPNSGERWDARARRWTGTQHPAADARRWRDAGARIIGGCCRTGPAYVAELRRVLRS